MKIAVVGAGLVGRLLAWRLSRAGYHVSLFDRTAFSEPDCAGWVAAAMLAPFSEAISHGEELLQPGLYSIQLWRRWLIELAEETQQRPAFYDGGTLLVNHAADIAEFQQYKRRLTDLCVRQQAVTNELGFMSPQGGRAFLFRLLEQSSVRDLEPDLGHFTKAIWLPLEACLDNRALFSSLLKVFEQRSFDSSIVCYPRTEITALTGTCLASHDNAWAVDQVIDCRGIGALPALSDLRAVRGEVLRVYAPEVTLSRPIRLMHPRYQLYIAPRPQQQYVVGATEIESDCQGPVTVRSSLELLSALYSIHKGFAEARVLESQSHCRPAFKNNLPQLRYTAAVPEQTESPVLYVNGLYRHGFLLGPLVVERVLDWLSSRKLCNVNSHELLSVASSRIKTQKTEGLYVE